LVLGEGKAIHYHHRHSVEDDDSIHSAVDLIQPPADHSDAASCSPASFTERALNSFKEHDQVFLHGLLKSDSFDERHRQSKPPRAKSKRSRR
jgi:hypothetical protein